MPILVQLHDRSIVEILHELMQGRKTHVELIRKLKDPRKLKNGLSEIEKLELQLRLYFGFYKTTKIPIHVLKESSSESNGKSVRYYEKNSYISTWKFRSLAGKRCHSEGALRPKNLIT